MMMALSDGQIAMGIIELVALALPAIAVLSQVYFRVSENDYKTVIGFSIFIGGGAFILSGVLSALHLKSVVSSEIIDSAIEVVVVGLVFIGIILYLIYSASKHDLRKLRAESKEHKNIAEELLRVMREHDVQKVSELRETEYDTPDELRDETTREELKKVINSSENIIETSEILESPFRNAVQKVREGRLTALRSRIVVGFIILVSIILAVQYFRPSLAGNPVFLVVVCLLGWGLEPTVNWITANIF